jgi:hypothetical protein
LYKPFGELKRKRTFAARYEGREKRGRDGKKGKQKIKK